MEGFFDAIANRDRNLPVLAATVMDGAAMGERALLSGDRIVWMTGKAQLIPNYIEEISAAASGTLLEKEDARIFCERIGSEKQLVICGAGHVSMPILKIGKMLGFAVTVIDDRPKFADDARREKADQVLCDSFDAALGTIQGSPDTYFVVVTRGHRYDTDCLRAILGKPYAYLGMMGSRRRTAFVKQTLIEEGFPADAVERIYTPIGLKIGAETPEEIAVSVMAEMIQVKNANKANDTYTEELLSHFTGDQNEKRRMVLATIISRRGSAPRSVGTKMLILEDGQTVGTIGGGCMESDVIRQARWMMLHEMQQKLIRVEMTEDQAGESGMVCGGTVEIYMERVGACLN